ncbi:MAG: two-component regulator propeller domain-containing protein [Cellvibrio sp.]
MALANYSITGSCYAYFNMMKKYLVPGFSHCATNYVAFAALRWKQCWLLFLVLLGVASLNVLAADEPSTAPPGYILNSDPKRINFRNIMQNQDIALGEVEALIQDYEGFMWLGGRNALLRHDGYEFLNISAADPSDFSKTFPIAQTLELFEDSRRNLWVATRSGLLKYNREFEVLLPQGDAAGSSLLREVTYALAESPDGDLLIGTSTGLYILNLDTMELKIMVHDPADPYSLAGNNVNDILVEKNGTIWLGLNEGLARMEWSSKKTSLVVLDPANPVFNDSNGIRTITKHQNGDIWAGSNKGVYRLNPTTGATRHYQHDPKNANSIANDLVRQIYVDSKGWVWCGSDNGGISIYDQGSDSFIRLLRQEGVPDYSIRSVYEDKIGDIWVGNYPSGVNIFDRSTAAVTWYRKSPDPTRGLLDDNVEAVEEDRDGNLLVGAGGMSRYNPKSQTFTAYQKTDDSTSRSSTTSFLNGVVDADGEIYFGSWAHGVVTYDEQDDRFESIPVDPTQVKRGEKTGTKLNDEMVWSVYEDKQKNLWMGTHFNGLTKLDKKTGIYTFYPHDKNDSETISCPVVWTTFEDSKGRFWVGTAYGLNLMDREKGTFKRYIADGKDPHGLKNGSVLSIWEDRKGRIWFGTDGGLHLYHSDSDNFSMYGTKDGFVDQGIRVILEDEFGNLWMGTNNGIVMFNPDTKLVKNYTRYTGELIGGASTGAGLVSQKGEMVFGTRHGLYILNPEKMLVNTSAPPVVLTDFRIFTQKVAVNGSDKILTKALNQTKEITLDYTKAMIAFSFAALNYRDPEKNQYAYKLEGFDDDWRDVGNQRTALYTNLPAGKYQFKVKASNNDGVWNAQGHTISLTILPPPWKTWWAYCIYSLMGLGVLLLFIYSQHKKVLDERKTNRKLEIKVAERTAELQNKNMELERAYAQLEDISLSDPLTGLSNRRYLQKLMPMDIAKVQREYGIKKVTDRPQKKPSLDLTFFILDVDFFKSVNDLHGHSAGDTLLVQLSELLTNICRESDCVIRWGGEEFIIVSRFADREEAPLMAERIRKSIERHSFTLQDDTVLHKTCSIGFACFPFLKDHPMDLSWEQVIDVADHALYAAKRSGRNRSVGLAANENTSEQMLHHRIVSNLKELVINNELHVISDKPEDLVWD